MKQQNPYIAEMPALCDGAHNIHYAAVCAWQKGDICLRFNAPPESLSRFPQTLAEKYERCTDMGPKTIPGFFDCTAKHMKETGMTVPDWWKAEPEAGGSILHFRDADNGEYSAVFINERNNTAYIHTTW